MTQELETLSEILFTKECPTLEKSKFYRILLVKLKNCSYRVLVNYGQRGDKGEWATKLSCTTDLTRAEQLVNAMCDIRVQRGYARADDCPVSQDAANQGLVPSLRQEITLKQALDLLATGDWVAQPFLYGPPCQLTKLGKEQQTSSRCKPTQSVAISAIIPAFERLTKAFDHGLSISGFLHPGGAFMAYDIFSPGTMSEQIPKTERLAQLDRINTYIDWTASASLIKALPQLPEGELSQALSLGYDIILTAKAHKLSDQEAELLVVRSELGISPNCNAYAPTLKSANF